MRPNAAGYLTSWPSLWTPDATLPSTSEEGVDDRPSGSHDTTRRGLPGGR
jgi:hypothetical protein